MSTGSHGLEWRTRWFACAGTGDGFRWKKSTRGLHGPFESGFLSEFVTVKELGSWEDIRFDFAIIGIDRCGTTSLGRERDRERTCLPFLCFWVMLDLDLGNTIPLKTTQELSSQRSPGQKQLFGTV